MTHGRRLIVFDLDGTLVDSRRDLASSMNALLAEYGAYRQFEPVPTARSAKPRPLGNQSRQCRII